MADWQRFQTTAPPEPGVTEADPALGRRLRALGDCPAGSLGRAYFDFYDRWQIPFPGEAGGGDIGLVAHDFSHVLAGYEPDPPSELALQAMLTSATGFEHHFSGLVASLALFETGTFDILDITPKIGALDRPGAAAELAEAFRRGAACAGDFSAIDHLSRRTIRSTSSVTTAASRRVQTDTVVLVAWARGSASCRTPTCRPRCTRCGTRSAARSRAST